MTTALITGINGFAGKHLHALLHKKGRRVAGLDVKQTCDLDNVAYEMVDITDSDSVAQAFKRLSPDEIYHLAGVSFPAEADRTPRSALDINITGTISVIDAMKRFCPKGRLLVVGSAKEYDINAEGPVTEDIVPNPTNFYGISKYATELIGLQYCRQYGLDIRFTRSFNHTGPGQSYLFVCSDWARQVALAESGLGPCEVRVGDCNVEIDFSDVRDVVSAYRLIMEKGKKTRIYNVCSGKTRKLPDILDYLKKKSSKRIAVVCEKKKLGEVKTYRRLAGDNGRLRAETGWEPAIPFEKTLDDLYEYWLQELRKS
ncbi:MAG TPA: GDP-mannose 4,6-dehydratase [Chitinivibrionales bacterium]|nr:GDP-mannose 4,6-dehydratase [Chitinivibrionales bacterium]